MSSLRPGLLLAAAVLVASACCLPRSSGPVADQLRQQPHEPTAPDREMAALAFIAYTGEGLTGTTEEVEASLATCMPEELRIQPLTRDEWHLVWGPRVFKFELAKLDDNMMYVVRSRSRPERLVVAVRGTNSEAILDWLLEDFDVGTTVAWEWTTDWTGPEPRISKATHIGLQALQGMGAEEHNDLRTFLGRQVKNEKVRSVAVVGHSLAGALAPTLALWLEDTRDQWDKGRRAEISVWGFAGPTPGDRAFAHYYDHRLGGVTQRIHNPYDVVPQAWQQTTLERIPGLYEPLVRASPELRGLTCAVVDLTRKHHYWQQLEDEPPIPGHLFEGVPDYARQAACQHTCGYYRALGLVAPSEQPIEPLILPITTDCEHFHPEPDCKHCPMPRCAPCPGWGAD